MWFQHRLRSGCRVARRIWSGSVRTRRFQRELDRNQSQAHWFSYHFHFSFWLLSVSELEHCAVWNIVIQGGVVLRFGRAFGWDQIKTRKLRNYPYIRQIGALIDNMIMRNTKGDDFSLAILSMCWASVAVGDKNDLLLLFFYLKRRSNSYLLNTLSLSYLINRERPLHFSSQFCLHWI